MIAGGDYYIKLSGINTDSGQIDTYTTTQTGVTIDFDNSKTGEYNLLTDNFQNNGTGTVFMSGLTIIPKKQNYIYDWQKVISNIDDSVNYQIDSDNDGNYDITSNFSAIPKELNAKGSISGYVKGDTTASMAGWKICMDENKNGTCEENKEQFTTTDNKGYYKFANIDKGNYSILEIIKQNWITNKSKYNINLNNGQNVVNLNFENTFTKGKK
ncbi:MAG: carboxypeptidase-like regulatory domain-containing protein [Candidatus Gracilibacteria bacterium]|nr:carboxypeptidase-like regulatory domain-containing protein [Candidatus Gracilibacteria bacterium]